MRRAFFTAAASRMLGMIAVLGALCATRATTCAAATVATEHAVATVATEHAATTLAAPATTRAVTERAPSVVDSWAAAADTSFGRYLQSLHDSSDVFFRTIVAPVDTAGLDSVLAVRLAHPATERATVAGAWRPVIGPWLGFNRVDGPGYGGAVAVGRRRGLGVLGGRAAYAVAAKTWLGSGEYVKTLHREGLDWKLDLEAGRSTASMDRERSDIRLGALRAFLTGNDTRRYLRHDGFDAALDVEHPAWRGGLAYRDMNESPLEVRARWNLTGGALAVADNLPAARGHVHELGYTLGVRTPWIPFTAEAEYFTSSRKLGSAFEYRRYRVGLGGDLPIRRTFTLVPQVEYGRLTGDPLPQESFYLGGSRTLRSLEGDALGGTGLTLARLDLLELPDMLEVLHVPHPAMLPLQLGAFVATGAVWGVDPYGGPTRPGVDFAEEPEFRSEAGVSILYRPGLPDPSTYLEIGWGWPLGAHSGPARLSVSYSRGVDLVKPFGHDDSR